MLFQNSAHKDHPFLIRFIVSIFVLPDVAKTVAQKSKHQEAAWENYSNKNCHRAEEAMMDMVTLQNEANVFPALQKFLTVVVSEESDQWT